MKLIGNLLMTVTLLAGLLAAATSYLAPVTSPEDSWIDYINTSGKEVYIHSNNPAGATTTSEDDAAKLRAQYERGEITAQAMLTGVEELHPIVAADAPLSPENRAKLTGAAGEGTRQAHYVNIKRFSPMGWKYNWLFGICVIGLFTGAMLVRKATQREIAAHSGDENQSASHESPDGILAQIRLSVDRLRADLGNAVTERERTHLIVERVGALQKKEFSDFIDARPKLIARLGLGGYAELMDRFAAAERQVNRAWSIAADGFFDEAAECLENSAHLLVEAQEKLVK